MILKASMWRTGCRSYERYLKIKGTFPENHISSKLYHSSSIVLVSTLVRMQEKPVLEGDKQWGAGDRAS
jgi:hypothetical protein